MKPLFPIIDKAATGKNIVRLRRERGLSVRDIQKYFGFNDPQAIYQWQTGRSLPSVRSLYALSCLFDVSVDDVLVRVPLCLLISGSKQLCGKDKPIHFIQLCRTRSALVYVPCRLAIPILVIYLS